MAALADSDVLRGSGQSLIGSNAYNVRARRITGFIIVFGRNSLKIIKFM